MSSVDGTSPQHNEPIQPKYAGDDTTLILHEIKHYVNAQSHGFVRLYSDFREIFDGWTTERFQKVDPTVLRDLRWTLHHGGVYTGHLCRQTAGALADLAQLPCIEEGLWPYPPYWPMEELLTTHFDPRSAAHQTQAALKASRAREEQQDGQTQGPPDQVLPTQTSAPAPPQPSPVQGPSTRAQPSRASTSVASSQPQPLQNKPVQQQQAVQQQRQVQQPNHQLQPYQSQPGYDTQQPPQYSQHPHPQHVLHSPPQVYNDQNQGRAPQTQNPFPHPNRQRPIINPSGRWAASRQASDSETLEIDSDYESSIEDEMESSEDDDYD